MPFDVEPGVGIRKGAAPEVTMIPKQAQSTSGFTLIEILIVVFIIGLLATVVSLNVIGKTDDARKTKAIADLKELEQGLHLFKLDNGFYPADLMGLIQKPPNARKYPPEGYLNQTRIPPDPWGNNYVYISDGGTYILRSFGADGEQGGDGYNADLDSRNLELG